MDSNKLKSDLNELLINKEKLERELEEVNKNIDDMQSIISKATIFNEEVLDYICALLSHFENNTFIPFIYTKNESFRNLNKVFEKVYVGITDEACFTRFSGDGNAEKLVNDNSTHLIFQSDERIVDKKQDVNKSTISFDFESTKEREKCFAFEFLLKEFNSKKSSSVEASQYNFEDYPYVQDFIRFLFEVQYEKNGQPLNSSEMLMILKIFFKRINKTKQMIKEKKN